MALRVSTVSADVAIDDLGIKLTHPTNNYVLTDYFTSSELRDSDDLAAAIAAGTLTADDGTFTIAADDFDRSEVLNQELGLKLDERFISNDELVASVEDTPVYSGVFPLALNSTASITKNVYAPGGKFGLWAVEPGDVVVIAGSSAADGTYTVDSVTDAQNFTVIETISDSTGGTVSIYHPVASTRIGIRNSTLQWTTTATDLQGALDDLDPTGSGLSANEHRDLDQLVHLVAEDSYEEITYSGIFATNITTWTDSGKTTKIREEQYTYIGNKPQTGVIIQYDATGTEVERINETYNYTSGKISSIDRELV